MLTVTSGQVCGLPIMCDDPIKAAMMAVLLTYPHLSIGRVILVEGPSRSWAIDSESLLQNMGAQYTVHG